MLPGGEDIRRYRAEHAPELVSQVAAVTEALELGSPLLLIDEDSTAPPLLQRDALRAALMPGASEPVVPISDLARRLFAEHGVSTILVSGTASEYAAADTIIGMDRFRVLDITQGAKQAAAGAPVSTVAPEGPFGGIGQRVPAAESVGQFRGRRVRSEVRGDRAIVIGREQVDMHGVTQLVESGQARAIGDAIVFAGERGYVDGSRSLREIVSLIDAELSERGLEVLSPFSGHPGDYARPRRHEIAAAFNRLRTLRIR
jgi:predicted ABC-class ATPase